MSNLFLNASQKIKPSNRQQNIENQFLPLYTKNQLNSKLKTLLKSIKNNFGVVSCIGSQNFYVYTRQMLLHMDFNTAINIRSQKDLNPLEIYKSQQLEKQNIDIDIISPKQNRKQSLDEQLQTSFAKANSQEIKNILQTQIYEIQSEYELSHNQLMQKQLQIPQFKKANSSFVQLGVKDEKNTRKNYILKNEQTLSQVENKSGKYLDDNFHKDVDEFKKSIQKKKVEEYMKKNGFSKVSINGQQEKYISKNDFLRIYNSKQIGTDKQKKPIEWVYSQLKTTTTAQAIQSVYLISSTIIYELPFEKQPSKEQFQKQIKNYFQFYRKLQNQINKYDDSNSDLPEIVIVCRLEESENLQSKKSSFKNLFNQLQAFYLPQNKRNIPYYQSPYSQYQNSHSPSKSKLPPTPKRMPVSHKPTQLQNHQSKKKVRLQFRIISDELSKSDVLKDNYSRMRQITTQGRQIFNQQNVKTFGGNWATSDCFIKLLERISNKMPNIDIQSYYQIWEQIFSNFLKSNMQDAVHKYEQKINELIIGKSMISQSRLLQAHQAAKKQTMRQFSQKKIGNSKVYIQSTNSIKSGLKLPSHQTIKVPSNQSISHSRRISISRKLVQSRKQLINDSNEQNQFEEENLFNLVQSRIEQARQEIQIKNKNESLKWGRKFLQSQYELIRKKIKLNQVKNLLNYKHQLQFLRQIFIKKLQNYSALQYELMQQFEMFIFENIFIGVESLLERERSQWQQQVKNQTQKVEQAQQQIKQIKKNFLIKQRSLLQQKNQALNKFQQLESNLQNLTNQLLIKNNEISYLKAQNEQKISFLQSEHSSKQSQLRNQIQAAKKVTRQKNQDFLYIQSQLQKQQLLHRQTHDNYQQILLNYKNNVSQLEKKLKQIKENNLINEQRMKNSLFDNQTQQEIRNKQIQDRNKIQMLQNLFQQKDKQLIKFQTQLQNQIQEHKQIVRQLEGEKSQNQIQKKILQEKLIQIESRLPRYKSNQILIQKIEKEKEQLVSKIQVLTSSEALSLQKYQFAVQKMQTSYKKKEESFQKQIKSVQQTKQTIQQNNTQLKQELIKIKQTNQKYYSQINQNKCQQQVQTNLSGEIKSVKQKCLNCQKNKSKLGEALSLVQILNQNYQSIKQSYLKAKCHQCPSVRKNINKNNQNYSFQSQYHSIK